MKQDSHGYARVNVERSQQGCTGTTHAMRLDVAHFGLATASGIVTVEIARLIRGAVDGRDHKTAVVPGSSGNLTPVGLRFDLVPESRRADVRHRQRSVRVSGVGLPVVELPA